MSRQNNIILCGFMGTGKSAAGRLVSKQLGYTFIDSDELIEKRCQMSVAGIFTRYGEEYFRTLENQVAREMLSVSSTVLAAGGGMIISPENLEILGRAGKLILLSASVETICQRVNGTKIRPLLGEDNLQSLARKLLSSRKKIYNKVKCHLNTDDLSIDEVSDKIIKLIEENR